MSLTPFRALPGRVAVRDVRDLMTYPFFSLCKTRRISPLRFDAGGVLAQVEGTATHGIATIWDADILIWAASQLMEARDSGLPTSRCIVATPCEILRFIGRGTSARDYLRLRAALDRLQSTAVCTSLHQSACAPGMHRFSWISEWRDCDDGLQIVLSDWFYRCVAEHCAVLTIDRAYFGLSGGIERWLYRLVRKHAGRQPGGWRFDFKCLHAKSGSMARFKDFAVDLRRVVRQQSLPGYLLQVRRMRNGDEVLAFAAVRPRKVDPIVRQLAVSMRASSEKRFTGSGKGIAGFEHSPQGH